MGGRRCVRGRGDRFFHSHPVLCAVVHFDEEIAAGKVERVASVQRREDQQALLRVFAAVSL